VLETRYPPRSAALKPKDSPLYRCPHIDTNESEHQCDRGVGERHQRGVNNPTRIAVGAHLAVATPIARLARLVAVRDVQLARAMLRDSRGRHHKAAILATRESAVRRVRVERVPGELDAAPRRPLTANHDHGARDGAGCGTQDSGQFRHGYGLKQI